MICERCEADIESIKIIVPELRDYASWVRVNRNYLRLSQLGLAKLAGVSINTISRIETEGGMPSKKTRDLIEVAIDKRMNP
jgi:transcriptional regulator with XRE-family HTH domain